MLPGESSYEPVDGVYKQISIYYIFSYDNNGFHLQKEVTLSADIKSSVSEGLRGLYIGDYYIIADADQAVSLDMNNEFKEVSHIYFAQE